MNSGARRARTIRTRLASRLAAGLLVGGLCGTALPNGFDPLHGGGIKTTTGVIYKQGLVLDEGGGGGPIYVEYDRSSGSVVETLTGGVFSDPGADLRIANGRDYRAEREQYLAFRDALPEGHLELTEVIAVDAHPLAGYPADIAAGEPFESTRSLLVYRPEALEQTSVRLDVEKGAILFESRYDLEELLDASVEEGDSLLIDARGAIAHRTENTIGYQVAYVKRDGEYGERGDRYERGDELVAPIEGAWVENGMSIDNRTATREDGRYFSRYVVPPCPGFSYPYEIPIYAGIPFRSFNPQRQGGMSSYLLTGTSYYHCVGAPLAPPSLLGPGYGAYLHSVQSYATLDPQLPSPVNFAVDVTLISGRFTLHNEADGAAIPVGQETRYEARPERDSEDEFEDHAELDLNDDGKPDHVSKPGSFGSANLVEGAVPDESTSYGVWFDVPDGAERDDQDRLIDADGELIEPDLVRVADRKRLRDEDGNFLPMGLLAEISEEDLRETDLYVFRSSTGQLVMEKTRFGKYPKSQLNGIDDEGRGFFELTIPGRDAGRSFRRRYSAAKSYEEWQGSVGVAESIQGHKSDSIRVGEPIRVIAINRVTGYIGTADTSIEAVGERDITIELPEMQLLPPNLKVHVQRQYEVEHGLSAGKTRTYTVGSEGSALVSDQYLSVHTEWLNQDGSPLPSELPGYSGRLSSIGANGTFDSYVGHFDIEPGKHIEVLELPGAGTGSTAAYSYVHVAGKPRSENPSFDRDPGGTYPYRPGRYVPVRVALYDEERSRELARAQKAASETASAETSASRPEQNSSVYQWVHRPEMMFSVYDLDVYRMDRVTKDGDGNERTLDVQEAERPVIGSGDDGFSVTQYLTASEYDPLSYFGPETDLLYSIEEYEQLAAPGFSRYEFGKLDFLGELDPEDYLSINLVNNQDAGNVLWEWAFEYLAIGPVLLDDEMVVEDGTIVISADDLPMDIHAIRFGGEQGKGDNVLTWRVLEGDATVETGPRQSAEDEGVWRNTLDISPHAGNEVVLEGRLGDDESSASRMRRVVVEPGLPADIEIATSGQAYMLGVGEIEVEITVRDREKNLVADGTPVALSLSGGGLLSAEELTTVGGIARAVVIGGEKPADEVLLTASSFDATEAETRVRIEPLTVEVSGLTGEYRRFERSSVRVTVSADGAPVPDVPVDLVATHGVVGEYSVETNARGHVDVPLVHLRPGEDAALTVGLGTAVHERREYAIAYDDGDGSWLETVDTLVIGDRAASGTFTHERYDGVALNYDYATTSPFAVQGEAGERVEVTLGDFSDPNLAPLASWPMDALEVLPADTVFHDATLGAGASTVILVEAGQKTAVNGFRMNVALAPASSDAEDDADDRSDMVSTPTEAASTTLLDMDGALQLVRDPDGAASLVIQTDEGTRTLRSRQSLTLVHEIEVRLIDGTLSFRIDEEREEVSLRREALAYSGEGGYTLSAPSDLLFAYNDLAFETPARAATRRGRMLDATTVHVAATVGGTTTIDAPMGAGRSLHLASGGTLSAALSGALAPKTGLGFRIDMKRPSGGSSGSAVDTDTSGDPEAILLSAGGAMILERLAGDALRLTATTDTGTYAVESGADTFVRGRWHTVAARMHDGELALYVDGEVSATAAVGAFDYGETTTPTLTLHAPNESMSYDALRLYDWTTEPLLAITGAGDEKSTDGYRGELDTAGRLELTLTSLGHLNDQQVGSALQTLRVAVRMGEERDYVSLVSSEYYQDMSAVLLEHFTDGVPPIEDNLNGSLPIEMMIGALDLVVPPAQAGVLSFGWSAINFLIPVGDAVILTQQLFYLASNSDEYDSSELIGSALGTLTVIPLAKPLKPFIPGLKGFLRVAKGVDGRFFSHASGPLGRAVKRAFKGKTDEIVMWLPTIYLFAQMTSDEESRQALVFILNSIASEEDMRTWITYLSLPTDGWEGEGSVVASIGGESESSSSLTDFFIGTANAQSFAAKRVLVRVRQLVRVINSVKQSGRFNRGSSIALMSSMRAVVKAMRRVDAQDVRSMIHTRQILIAGAALAGNGLTNVINNAARMRVPAPLLIAVIAYVDDRRSCLGVFKGSVAACVTHEPEIARKLNGTFGGMIARLAVPRAAITNYTNGATFEMLMLAYKHALFELGLSNWKPKEIGYDTRVSVTAGNVQTAIGRRVDLVLTQPTPERLSDRMEQIRVESKSYTQSSLTFRPWTVRASGGGGEMHREYALDCAFRTAARAATDSSTATDFEWWFQKFRGATSRTRSPDVLKLRRFSRQLGQVPASGVPREYDATTMAGPMCSDRLPQTLFSLRTQFVKDSTRALVTNGLSDRTKNVIDELVAELD